MLRLESSPLREFLGSKIIKAVIDKLIDLDVRNIIPIVFDSSFKIQSHVYVSVWLLVG